MVEVKVTKHVETVISGPTKIPDPDATPYDDDITYENIDGCGEDYGFKRNQDGTYTKGETCRKGKLCDKCKRGDSK